MNTPVSFELAKLLKEKGFDGNHEYMVFTSVETEIYPEGELFLKPTIAEVVMWLYDKHGIWISVLPSYTWNYTLYSKITHLQMHSDGLFNSPTEAYEAAIEYALNNLI